MKALLGKGLIAFGNVYSCGQTPTFICKNLNPNLLIQRNNWCLSICQVLLVLKFINWVFAYLLALLITKKLWNMLSHCISIITLWYYHLHFIDKDRESHEAKIWLEPRIFFFSVSYTVNYSGHFLTQDIFWTPIAMRLKFIILTKKKILRCSSPGSERYGLTLGKTSEFTVIFFDVMCFILRRHSKSGWSIAPNLRLICYSKLQKGFYNWRYFKMLNIELPYNSPIPLLGTYSRKMKTHIHTKTCTQIFTAFVYL